MDYATIFDDLGQVDWFTKKLEGQILQEVEMLILPRFIRNYTVQCSPGLYRFETQHYLEGTLICFVESIDFSDGTGLYLFRK